MEKFYTNVLALSMIVANALVKASEKRIFLRRIILFSTTLFFVNPWILAQTPDTWIQKANFPDYGGNGFNIGDKAYIGDLGDNSLWEYDPSTDTWTEEASFPGSSRSGSVTFSVNGIGYVGTGFGCPDYGCHDLGDFWKYDPNSNAWSQISGFDFEEYGRESAVGFSIGDKGYFGLGEQFEEGIYVYNDFWEYDPTKDTWSQKADFEGGYRFGASGFSIGNYGYIGTGSWEDHFAEDWTDYNDFWQYDPSNNTWTQKANFAGDPRGYAVGFSINDKGYIGTGLQQENYTHTTFADVWEYDPSTDSWIRKTDFGGGATNGAVGITIGGNAYVLNGNDWWEYTPDNSCTPPFAKITPLGSLDICSTGYVNLKATSGNNYSYQWFLNSATISGATYQLYRAKQTGCYQVSITNGAGCNSISRIARVTSSCRLEGEANISSLNLFPNPTNGAFNLDLDIGAEENTNANIEVLNQLGQIVLAENGKVESGNLAKEIKLNAAPGMYLVRVIIGDQVFSKQMSLQE